MKNINDFNMDFFSLKGKNAIVTGGVSGLGQAFALALAKAGANIFVLEALIFWLTVQVSARSQMFLTLAELSGIR